MQLVDFLSFLLTNSEFHFFKSTSFRNGQDNDALICPPSLSHPADAQREIRTRGTKKATLICQRWLHGASLLQKGCLFKSGRESLESVIIMIYESMEVDTFIVAAVSLRSCNAGRGSCSTLQQMNQARIGKGCRTIKTGGKNMHSCIYTGS